jgi:hypothetical protein
MASEDRRKHLDYLQSVVSRLAGNSFSIKGWAVALVAILGGFAAKDSDPRFVFGLWLPVFCFWGLDAFYLRQERLFRRLYDAAVKEESSAPVYSMDVRPFESEVPKIIKVAFSRTVLSLHLSIFVFVCALSIFSIYRAKNTTNPTVATRPQGSSALSPQPTPR